MRVRETAGLGKQRSDCYPVVVGEEKLTRLQVFDPTLGAGEEWTLGRAWTGDIEEPSLGLQGSVGGVTPVQGEGTLDGNPWYFRARHEHWTFTMAQPGGDPHKVRSMFHSAALEDGWNIERSWPFGEFSAGYMPVKSALAIIRACARMYRAGTLPAVKADLAKFAEEEKELDAWFASIREASYCGCGHNQPDHGIRKLSDEEIEARKAIPLEEKIARPDPRACIKCDCTDFRYSAEESAKHNRAETVVADQA